MKYTTAQVAYHWISFAMILFMAGSGMAYSLELIDKSALTAHQIAGQILIVVLVLRIISRATHERPANEASTWEHRLAQATHLALYLVMVAYVVTGYVSASGLNTPALLAPMDIGFARSDMGERFLDAHYQLKWALLALVTLHICGALKHRFWDKDDTLSNMTFTNRKD